MTALLIVAVLAVAGFVAFKISKSKEKLEENHATIVEPVKQDQPKVEAVIEAKKPVEKVKEVAKKETVAPKKELKLKEKKKPVEDKKKEDKPKTNAKKQNKNKK